MPDDLLASGVGVGAGAASTLLIRQQFDQTGETTVLRPSVLWGVGSGVAAYVAPMFLPSMGRGMIGPVMEEYGMAALVAGLFSAFSPKGGDVRLPTV